MNPLLIIAIVLAALALVTALLVVGGYNNYERNTIMRPGLAAGGATAGAVAMTGYRRARRSEEWLGRWPASMAQPPRC